MREFLPAEHAFMLPGLPQALPHLSVFHLYETLRCLFHDLRFLSCFQERFLAHSCHLSITFLLLVRVLTQSICLLPLLALAMLTQKFVQLLRVLKANLELCQALSSRAIHEKGARCMPSSHRLPLLVGKGLNLSLEGVDILLQARELVRNVAYG